MIDKIFKSILTLYRNYIYEPEQNHIKNKQEFKEAFKASITPQLEDDFINICFQNCNKSQRKVALSTRKVIAMLGEVEVEYIRADILFKKLDGLDFWRSCEYVGFNTEFLAEELLKELGIKSNNLTLRRIF